MQEAFVNQTTLHPLGALATVALSVAVCVLPRQRVLVPLLLMICFLAPAQRVAIAGADFTLLRMVTLVGLLRVAIGGELWRLRLGALDLIMICYGITSCAIYTIQGAKYGGEFGMTSSLVARLGTTVDSLGAFFLCRAVLVERRDYYEMVRWLAMLSIPVAACFVVERATRHNIFSVFGGVPAVTEIRDGRLRCQGAFPHPILAGCFWAALLPLFVGWAVSTRRYTLGTTACAAALFVVFASGSSTPVMAVLFGACGAGMYFFRRYMRIVQLGLLATLICLHFVLNGPVWSILAKINVLSSSTGWYRYYLIDRAIANFSEWWLLGTRSTSEWGHGLWDITNQYVLEGVRGGVWSLLLFVSAIWLTFRMIGLAIARLEGDSRSVVLVWSVGVAVFVHAMNFLAVSYFGQMTFVWYLMLAAGVCAARTSPSRLRMRGESKTVARTHSGVSCA